MTFDAPLDGAVEVNLLGPTRVAEALNQIAGERVAKEGAAQRLPHLVAVSTAYVNSGHKGDASEELITSSKFVSKIDWRAEVQAARRAPRSDEDASSRSPERLAAFCIARHGGSWGGRDRIVGRKDEQLRTDWVRDRMVALGRGRSRALGWPDAYAFTKSLGETALLDMRGELPVTFVRPSIVESSLSQPRPDGSAGSGWRSPSSSPTPRVCCAIPGGP